MAGTELFGDEERKEVADVMETGIFIRYNQDEARNGHWKAKTFEKEFSAYHNIKYTHMCASGTAADAISLAACGVGAGDEVIVSPFSFIAPVEAVLAAGAIPVFADIDETLCLSPEGIQAAITPRTKAVLLVHVFGAMARTQEIADLCKAKGITLIEDAAPALGASQNGKLAGTFGKVGCYSFDFYKIITAGEGGAMITNDETAYNTAHMFGDHGHDHIGDNRGMEEHPILGFNYRVSELHAAVGLAQFRKLDTIITALRKNKTIVKDGLKTIPELTFRRIDDEPNESATFLSFFLKDKATAEHVKAALDDAGIGAAYWVKNKYHYIHNWEHLKEMKVAAKMPVSMLENAPDYRDISLPVSEGIMERLLMLEIKVLWSDDEAAALRDKLVTTIQNALK